LYFETWFSLSDAFAASLKTPSGQKVDGPTSRDGVSTPEGKVYISEDSTEKGRARVVYVSSSKDLPRDNWTVTLTGRSIIDDGAWDAWIATYGQIIDGSGYEVTNRKTIIIPGTAQNIITVGAYVTKMRWTNRTGESQRYTSSEKEGDIAVFSSTGPTRDGRLKPEISAPGKGIVAPRSSDTKAGEADPDDFYTIKAGTSMAAPHIAGVVALLLQYNFYLGPNQSKSTIQSTSRQDERTGEIDLARGSTVWGYGKVDAKPAVPRSSGMYSIRISVKGIPPSSSTRISIDGVDGGLIAGEASTVFEFEDQITHTISADKMINTSDKTRYVDNQNSIKFSSPIWHTFFYSAQYHVNVISEYGNPRGSGWYDSGSTATISVEPAVTPITNVMLIYKKTTYATFDHWIIQPSGSISLTPTPQATVFIDGPKVITAEWRTQASLDPDWIVVSVLAIAVAGAAVATSVTRRRLAFRNAVATRP
jgi:subtilisin family serine protease